MYECIIVHATEIKFEINRNTTHTTIEFGTTDFDESVNLTVRHRTIFTTIKFLDTLASIVIGTEAIIFRHDQF